MSSVVQKRLALLSGEMLTQATELLSKFPFGEQEDHLEAFEMQQGRPLSKETLSAFANYARVHGSEVAVKENLMDISSSVNAATMPQLSSSFAKTSTASVRVSVDNIMKTFGSGNRVFGVALDKTQFTLKTVNCVEGPYRFMDQSVEAKAHAMIRKTNHLSEQIVSRCTTEEPPIVSSVASLASLQLTGDDNQLIVGRIVAETEDRLSCLLNLQTLLLEDTLNSNGRRTRLIIDNPDCGVLFPGQVVGAIGRLQRGGQEFIASKIIPGLCPDALATFAPNTQSGLHVTVAAGPFTPKDSLDYGALDALKDFVTNFKPHVLVLLGPFVDAGNSVISTGLVVDAAGNFVSFDDIYEKEVLPRLATLASACSGSDTRLVVLPSIAELCSDFQLPQPPLQWGENKNELAAVTFASNPCWLETNDVKIAVTSTDPLISLMGESLLVGQGKNKLDGCLEQLICQQSLFPGNSANIPIDPSHRPLLTLPAKPDIVVFASPATQIAKILHNTLFVNPGSIAKAGAGTIANVFVAPVTSAAEPEQRVRVEIAKLV